MKLPTNIRKIFSPDVIFSDILKASWCDNIESAGGHLTLHTKLKSQGIFALNIQPLSNKSYFVFCLPLNKDWKAEDISNWRNPILLFEVFATRTFKMSVQLLDENNGVVYKEDVDIPEAEVWSKFQVNILDKATNARLISFTGSAKADSFLIKSIVLKEK